MLKGFLRVVSRSVAIQLEEAAAASQASSGSQSFRRPNDKSATGSRRADPPVEIPGEDVDRKIEDTWLHHGQVFRQPGPQVGLFGGRTTVSRSQQQPSTLPSSTLKGKGKPLEPKWSIEDSLAGGMLNDSQQGTDKEEKENEMATESLRDDLSLTSNFKENVGRARSLEEEHSVGLEEVDKKVSMTVLEEKGAEEKTTPTTTSAVSEGATDSLDKTSSESKSQPIDNVAEENVQENFLKTPPTSKLAIDTDQASPLIDSLSSNPTTSPDLALPSPDLPAPDLPPPTPTLRPSKVPSSRLGRLFHYGSLVAGLSMGAATEYVRRTTGSGSGSSEGSVFMSEANLRRLVGKLGKMRGAALKLGQFMSIQDTNVLPEQLERVLQQVQAQADYMPDWQMENVMRAELGPGWESSFSSFTRLPLASASIGQVHSATLSSDNNLPVAVKIQFPGVQSSISSDLDNLSLLLRTSALLPRGLFLDNTLKVMRGELVDECDYIKEAENGRRMKEYLKDDEFFEVPTVIEELTTGKVLTTEMMSGKPLSQIKGFSQELRDKIGTAVLRLCLMELFKFRLMQTDPNWANFLYDKEKDKLQLIDFGATREYSVAFMDQWYKLLKSVVDGDREAMRVQSQAVGYLTGDENEEMVSAHLRSMELLATPFLSPVYDFSSQSVTDEVRTLIPTMLKYRLKPPPNETYSLNRKLSGSFLLCAKLGSRVRCKDLWEEIAGGYVVTEG